MGVLAFESRVMQIVFLVMLLVKVVAFVDALLRRPDAFVAAGKLTKPGWLVILGIAVAADLLLPSTLLAIAGIVAAFVYLLDVRPALVSITRGR